MLLSRRLVDFFNGVTYGIGVGIFTFIVGFLFGKISVLGYEIAWIAP
jgi:hypothetical protein